MNSTPTHPEALERWTAARAALAPLHLYANLPRPGDWLYSHPEAGETFEQYVQSRPPLPSPTQDVLVVAPLGAFSEAQERVLERTIEYLGLAFGLRTRRRDPVSLGAVPPPVRRIGDDGSVQVLTSWVLNKMLAPGRPADAAAVVAPTSCDLWPGVGWNFCFGEGRPSDRIGVWSVHRHGEPSHGARAEHLALRRSLKLAVHETGHVYSLRHCTTHPCVQAGINSLEEADRAPLWWCPDCDVKLLWATRSDAASRYERLAGFCAEAGLETEARFFRHSMAAVRGH